MRKEAQPLHRSLPSCIKSSSRPPPCSASWFHPLGKKDQNTYRDAADVVKLTSYGMLAVCEQQQAFCETLFLPIQQRLLLAFPGTQATAHSFLHRHLGRYAAKMQIPITPKSRSFSPSTSYPEATCQAGMQRTSPASTELSRQPQKGWGSTALEFQQCTSTLSACNRNDSSLPLTRLNHWKYQNNDEVTFPEQETGARYRYVENCAKKGLGVQAGGSGRQAPPWHLSHLKTA